MELSSVYELEERNPWDFSVKNLETALFTTTVLRTGYEVDFVRRRSKNIRQVSLLRLLLLPASRVWLDGALVYSHMQTQPNNRPFYHLVVCMWFSVGRGEAVIGSRFLASSLCREAQIYPIDGGLFFSLALAAATAAVVLEKMKNAPPKKRDINLRLDKIRCLLLNILLFWAGRSRHRHRKQTSCFFSVESTYDTYIHTSTTRTTWYCTTPYIIRVVTATTVLLYYCILRNNTAAVHQSVVCNVQHTYLSSINKYSIHSSSAHHLLFPILPVDFVQVQGY